MTAPDERRKEPSNQAISLGGLVAFLGLAGSLVTTYLSTQIDISNLKRGEQYQKETNARLSDEIRFIRQENATAAKENLQTAKEFNEKLDKIIDQWRPKK
jgi:hypothetical protein